LNFISRENDHPPSTKNQDQPETISGIIVWAWRGEQFFMLRQARDKEYMSIKQRRKNNASERDTSQSQTWALPASFFDNARLILQDRRQSNDPSNSWFGYLPHFDGC